jgi:hypothetical protein
LFPSLFSIINSLFIISPLFLSYVYVVSFLLPLSSVLYFFYHSSFPPLYTLIIFLFIATFYTANRGNTFLSNIDEVIPDYKPSHSFIHTALRI